MSVSLMARHRNALSSPSVYDRHRACQQVGFTVMYSSKEVDLCLMTQSVGAL